MNILVKYRETLILAKSFNNPDSFKKKKTNKQKNRDGKQC